MSHIVKISVHGAHKTYEIWRDNKRFLVPVKGQTLKKKDAYAIVELLNNKMELSFSDI